MWWRWRVHMFNCGVCIYFQQSISTLNNQSAMTATKTAPQHNPVPRRTYRKQRTQLGALFIVFSYGFFCTESFISYERTTESTGIIVFAMFNSYVWSISMGFQYEHVQNHVNWTGNTRRRKVINRFFES